MGRSLSTSEDFDRAILEFFADDPLTAYYIKQVGDPVFNATTGENLFTTEEIPVEALLLDMTLNSNGLSSKYGTEIMAGDKELYIRPPEKTDSSATPLIVNTTTDKVRVNGVDYKVCNMKEINPSASNPLTYYLHIRR